MFYFNDNWNGEEKKQAEYISWGNKIALKAKILETRNEFLEDLRTFLGMEVDEVNNFIEAVKRDAAVDSTIEIPKPQAAAFAVAETQPFVRKPSARLQRNVHMAKIATCDNADEIYEFILTL